MGNKRLSLIFCIIMDLMGYATYAVPFFGELADVVWAPVSAIIFYVTFGGWRGAVGGFFNFIEEFLPGTDFIPSFTLMWLWQNVSNKKDAANTKWVNKGKALQ